MYFQISLENKNWKLGEGDRGIDRDRDGEGRKNEILGSGKGLSRERGTEQNAVGGRECELAP